MKFAKTIALLIILSACDNIKNEAILASNEMISDITFNYKIIDKYFYEPSENVFYIFLNIFDDQGNWKQYSGKDFLEKYTEVKNSYGSLLNYEILQIEYDFNLFPFYDYGYPHRIDIELKCYYENIIKKETIGGYYIKEIGTAKIVRYFIKNCA
jgi:hypothetical protein